MKPSFIVSEAKAMLQAQNLHGHRKLQGWIQKIQKGRPGNLPAI